MQAKGVRETKAEPEANPPGDKLSVRCRYNLFTCVAETEN